MSGLPATRNLTEAEAAFVRAIAAGESPASACRIAGFAEEDAWKVTRRPQIAAAIHQEVSRAIVADAPISLKVLKEIRNDKGAPARTRADIGLKLLAMAGHGQEKTRSDDAKPFSAMSAAELIAFVDRNQKEIARLEDELAARAKDVTNQVVHQSAGKPLKYLD